MVMCCSFTFYIGQSKTCINRRQIFICIIVVHLRGGKSLGKRGQTVVLLHCSSIRSQHQPKCPRKFFLQCHASLPFVVQTPSRNAFYSPSTQPTSHEYLLEQHTKDKLHVPGVLSVLVNEWFHFSFNLNEFRKTISRVTNICKVAGETCMFLME